MAKVSFPNQKKIESGKKKIWFASTVDKRVQTTKYIKC